MWEIRVNLSGYNAYTRNANEYIRVFLVHVLKYHSFLLRSNLTMRKRESIIITSMQAAWNFIVGDWSTT